jgi:hexosaminidase
VLNFENSNSFAELPYNEIGYNYTVSFNLLPAANNAPNAILFQSNHAIVKLHQGTTTNLGFSHEGKDYDFGIEIPKNKWSNIVITGDNNSTTLYLDGALIKKLTREKIRINDKNDSIWIMKTLFFPLKTIGDRNNSFIGKIKDLKVFNQILPVTRIEAIKNEL